MFNAIKFWFNDAQLYICLLFSDNYFYICSDNIP